MSRAVAGALGLAAAVLVVAVVAVSLRSWARSGDRVPGGPSDGDARASGTPAAAPGLTGVPKLYVVQPGDTLSAIADRTGTTVEALIEANGLADPDSISVGQELILRQVAAREGPAVSVVPDGELVYGPAYLGFDPQAFVKANPGYLASYTEVVDGEAMTGAQIVDRVAREFLVGPRVLLAVLEARSAWVAGQPADEAAIAYPAGLADPSRAGLWLQLNWLADRLNRGYYDWRTRGSRIYTLADGTRLAAPASINAGSFALHYAIGLQSNEADLAARLSSVDAAYRALFGDPWVRSQPAQDLSRLDFPSLALPFARGERWWFTGGPHGGWADGSAWAAIDLVPDEDQRGCFVSTRPARAVADGTISEARPGSLWLDLDGDGLRQTGPGVFYLHLTLADGIVDGARVKTGDVLGYPSCEGGVSNATHLHLARAQDGEWLAAGGPAPLVLAGWRASAVASSYDGGLTHSDGRSREACECREPGYNDVAW